MADINQFLPPAPNLPATYHLQNKPFQDTRRVGDAGNSNSDKSENFTHRNNFHFFRYI